MEDKSDGKVLPKKISLKTSIIILCIVCVAIGIGFYIANNELTKAGRAQEEYQKQVSDELRKGTSNENNTTKDIKDMLPSKNQYVIDDDKARDAAIKARKKTLEAEKNEQINK